MSISERELDHWQSWVGKQEELTERIEPTILARYAAALGEDFTSTGAMPSLAHWAFFITAAQPDGMGPDGHPTRGGFLPPVTLPRRMFAASDLAFHQPLCADQDATRVTRIANLAHKQGKSGELVLLELDHQLHQAGALCLSEHQTIVYRGMGDPTPPVPETASSAVQGDVLWQPGPVDLFRFSAVTFNSHRIHYDLPYAQDEEGYPNLVVHGPFTAARLFRLATQDFGPLKRFTFRALAPLFCGQPIRLIADQAKREVRAIRCDGVVAMSASCEI